MKRFIIASAVALAGISSFLALGAVNAPGTPHAAIATAAVGDPTLTLVKNVMNNGGGTATPADWTLTASGPITFSGVGDSQNVLNVPVPAGTYMLSEARGQNVTGPYTPSVWMCIGDAVISFTTNSVTLGEAGSATCSITNTFTGPPTTTTTTTVPATTTTTAPATTTTTPGETTTTTTPGETTTTVPGETTTTVPGQTTPGGPGTTVPAILVGGGPSTTLAPGAPITAPSTPAPGCPPQDPQCPASGRGLG